MGVFTTTKASDPPTAARWAKVTRGNLGASPNESTLRLTPSFPGHRTTFSLPRQRGLARAGRGVSSPESHHTDRNRAILTRVAVDAPIRQQPSSLPTPRARIGAAGGEEPFPGTVLTAVRQRTAEDRELWQQAPRGSPGGAVHEAVLTVAAEETHSPALQERPQGPPLPCPPLPLWRAVAC